MDASIQKRAMLIESALDLEAAADVAAGTSKMHDGVDSAGHALNYPAMAAVFAPNCATVFNLSKGFCWLAKYVERAF